METMAAKVPRALAKAVDRLIASGRYANRSEVLRVAVRGFVESSGSTGGASTEPAIPPRVKAFYRRLRELAKDPRYRHRWVALHGDEVLDVADDHDALVRRILDRPEEPIDIGWASDEPEPRRLRLSSPVRVRRP
ncbi:MAG: ribbon-helix-helix protein, CopG family [Methanobacteriota archaeon]|nr:MAG: ribbon-helix-helix protein, CopG family [Euryarchaeota archaeon]